ncbi:MAG: 5'-methylthioadenosine phosphorylase [Spirochaetes bacterium GWD1_61_31]|nr:MAG: 5'-methylthioadenosine phosphorylase [Spirochaetes bacterium GWB1_60_80]OHD30318.1 MAG: 5'-methylthioadenosine phosphorylase [Spirochaetes bacterium GWC1_61_12]OHD35848.1 MAG: 5'-methylthioadenosine phosphorylase [Spirochaetes bacterium GWD1_61_31]OHD46790.1 MAG: 5'-methylthioadenosine phosphorylase [Spirochaetes bacterium GWE1_60_18]OHD61242.1 MAG: 5'-methylthioadenosine phosphorylase [Spirochaetes bacterium GWF1_60_12]HAP42998.1 S-methyl-5'-thioadenosine phosphorylase [Spirochaetacea
MVKIGIIGGSGLENPDIMKYSRELAVGGRFGRPSSTLTAGAVGGTEVIILSRHDRDHSISPTMVPNRANLLALADQGCSHILATTAVGSLRHRIRRGDFVLPDQFIDFTRRRDLSVFDSFADGLHHTPMAEPFDAGLRALLRATARRLGIRLHPRGTVVTIEGPRFSTRAESRLFRSWGADIINMSTAPECAIAAELGLPYAAIAMATDYDSWKADEAPVTQEAVLEIFRRNATRMTELLLAVIPLIGAANQAGGVGTKSDAAAAPADGEG